MKLGDRATIAVREDRMNDIVHKRTERTDAGMKYWIIIYPNQRTNKWGAVEMYYETEPTLEIDTVCITGLSRTFQSQEKADNFRGELLKAIYRDLYDGNKLLYEPKLKL